MVIVGWLLFNHVNWLPRSTKKGPLPKHFFSPSEIVFTSTSPPSVLPSSSSSPSLVPVVVNGLYHSNTYLLVSWLLAQSSQTSLYLLLLVLLSPTSLRFVPWTCRRRMSSAFQAFGQDFLWRVLFQSLHVSLMNRYTASVGLMFSLMLDFKQNIRHWQHQKSHLWHYHFQHKLFYLFFRECWSIDWIREVIFQGRKIRSNYRSLLKPFSQNKLCSCS